MAHKSSSISGQALRRRSGQAMAEFLVGLVCIMLLLAGLQQVSILSGKGFESMNQARYSLASQYIDPTPESLGFNFSGAGEAGTDGLNLTADDQHDIGVDVVYQDSEYGYLNSVNDDLIGGFLDSAGIINPNTDLKYNDGVYSESPALQMLYAEDEREVRISPFLKKLLQLDAIHLKREVWMPRWDQLK
ncbi:MAG: hypothetical protein JXR25_08760 [Pontiellaceae bacterium]|nr:hypothetical protein [Pontiellaceae bacterium]MBN2784905.1 hypothetical protein [Pontiellaceae bacterium]